EERQVIVRNVATGAAHGMRVGDIKVRDVRWASPDHLLIVTSATATILNVIAPKSEWRMVGLYNIKTQKMVRLLRDVENGLNVLSGSTSNRTFEGKPVVFAEGVRFDSTGRGRMALFRIELDQGKSKLVHEGFATTRDWLVGTDGQPMAENEYEPKSGQWVLKVRDGKTWRELKAGSSLHEPPYLMGLGRAANSILVAEPQEDGVLVREVGPDGAWGQAVMPAGAAPIRDPADERLIGHVQLFGDDLRYTFFEPRDQSAWKKVVAAYPGESVSLVSWSADRKKLIVLVDSPTEGPAYALVDLTTGRATWIGAQHAGLAKGDLAPVRTLSYKATDGLELSGYLLTPNGRPAKGLPLVVMPHGGPAVRDTRGFDWMAQALASRGYAVLKVNFRGSDGFGRAFKEAGYGQWGRKMQTDLSDGVRHLAAQGVIDPKRVCIVGASYGGYAAVAGAAFDRGVYRCAGSYGGITDLTRMAPWLQSNSRVYGRRQLIRMVGATDPKDPVMAQISPAQHAAQIDIPILLIHGRDDTVVPFEQSRVMAEALTKAGKPVELVSLPGEDHWLSRGDTRLQMLTATVAFLEKHNPPN
ncbi:S9 family peptidase, partial [Phenylobacterium sp.]|uniref:alpha/beta hydrolase family protein n=1 Tax=Phenylobacterium sp. TaxID=1871053 RepID=UPI00286A3819